jgi:hypothetical protein
MYVCVCVFFGYKFLGSFFVSKFRKEVKKNFLLVVHSVLSILVFWYVMIIVVRISFLCRCG